ncbi:GGDEF domain-containing protein [Romboutsia sp.]|uniref:GGDEF domain-containing protein n=1 Tax=Romboutsia sp. TaxID=1965302 RepID=UPI003F2ACAB9
MNRISKKIDLYMIGLFLEVFILFCILFLSNTDNQNALTFITIGISFFTIIITYVGGMITGLILTSICIFFYSLYIFYNNLIFNVEISYVSYIWMIILAMITLTMGKLSESIINLQNINERLQNEYKELVTIDYTTGLGNIKNFYKYLDKEMSRAKRHNVKLSLMIINLPYYAEIKGIIGENKYNILIKQIGDIITNSTRGEDDIYSLNNDMLAIIMPDTDKDGALIVKNRIKTRLNELNLDMNQSKYNINIDSKIAIIEYDEKIQNAIQYKQLCEAELEYDV